jgi:signal transduction histidine kinase
MLFFSLKENQGLFLLFSIFFLSALFLNSFWFFKVTRNFKNIVEIARKESFPKKENTFLSSFSEKVKREIREIIDQKNENEEILDSLIEGVIAFDKSLNITYVNLMAEKMLQDCKKNLINKNLKDLKMPVNFIKNCENIIVSSQEKTRVLKEPIIIEESTKVFLDIIAIPKKQNQGALLILQDRTSDYKMLQMGKDFIANASHELKTPLTIIRGYAETLEDLELAPEMIREIMQKITRTSERLEKIIYDLLKLAEIENHQPQHFKRCDLKQIVSNCKEMALLAHKNARIDFLVPKNNFFVLGEEGLLELAIKNLLENAIKYSEEVFITISLKKEKGKALFVIKDRGIGIAKDDLPFIFDRFFTKGKTKKKGTGLGLAIVKNIIEKHDGQISVSSDVGKGSAFQVTLPL